MDREFQGGRGGGFPRNAIVIDGIVYDDPQPRHGTGTRDGGGGGGRGISWDARGDSIGGGHGAGMNGRFVDGVFYPNDAMEFQQIEGGLEIEGMGGHATPFRDPFSQLPNGSPLPPHHQSPCYC